MNHDIPLIRFAENRCRADAAGVTGFSFDETRDVRRLHRLVPGYAPTGLVWLDDLAARGGVAGVAVKDEASRFGLKAFKGLGGVYAMFRVICRELGLDPAVATPEALARPPYRERIGEMVFATTTDGNHGKGVSWAAKLFGCQARVYMPRGTVPVRAEAIRQAGNARVEVTDLRYDDCVARTRDMAAKNGWLLIQDTSWPGYEEVPLWIMRGYTTLFYEAVGQLERRPTHMLLQTGVGAMAGAIAAAALQTWPEAPPVIATVDPTQVACFYDSFAAGDGAPREAVGSGETIMAGLNCAVPCTLAWDILGRCAAGGFACEDEITRRGMRLLARHGVVAGESGAVTTGLAEALLTDPGCRDVRKRLGLDGDSVLLLINTEGDTDPENYRRIVGG